MTEKAEKNINTLLIGGGPDHFGMLNDEVVNLWSQLTHQKFVWEKLSGVEKERLLRLNGCLNKLSACLLQCSRLSAHYNSLILEAERNSVDKFPPDIEEAHLAYAGTVACSDFEALLLQGCAALDRLTYFLSSEYKTPNNRYRKLVNILGNFAENDRRALELIEIQRISEAWVDGVLTIFNSPRSFRDIVAHNEAASERMNSCFAVTLLEKRRALIYDCEVGGLGIYETTCEAAVHLPYLVLNSLAIMFDLEPIREIEAFSIDWENQTVLLRNFALEEPANSPLGPNVARVAKRMIPSGVELMTRNVNPGLYDFAMHFSGKSA